MRFVLALMIAAALAGPDVSAGAEVPDTARTPFEAACDFHPRYSVEPVWHRRLSIRLLEQAAGVQGPTRRSVTAAGRTWSICARSRNSASWGTTVTEVTELPSLIVGS